MLALTLIRVVVPIVHNRREKFYGDDLKVATVKALGKRFPN